MLLSCPQFGGPGPCALPQNAGDAKVTGVEVEIIAMPIADLQIDLSGSYLHWDWKCVDPQVVPGPVAGCDGLLERLAGDRSAVRDPDRIHQGAGARRRPV